MIIGYTNQSKTIKTIYVATTATIEATTRNTTAKATVSTATADDGQSY